MSGTNPTLERLVSANAVPSEDSLPSGALSSQELLARIDERSMGMTETTRVDYAHKSPEPPRSRRGLLVALGVAAAVLVIGLLGLLAANRRQGLPPQQEPTTTTAAEPTAMSPTEAEHIVDAFAAALRAGDGAAASALVEGATEDRGGFIDFLIALDTTELEFSDCEYGVGTVRCTATMGPDHFYEQIHGQSAETTFTAAAVDGRLADVAWGPAPADIAAAAEFRAWVGVTHPEMSHLMFDGTPMGILTEESGATMMSLLDEFLVDRARQVTATFVAALRDRDADAAQALFTEPADDGFLYWVTTLDTSGVEFPDCSYEPDVVRCTTRMGPDFWFVRIHGQNDEGEFTAHLEGGKIASATWPPSQPDLQANSEFAQWLNEAHPDLVDAIFDLTPIGKLTKAAAEARVELLDEFLASR